MATTILGGLLIVFGVWLAPGLVWGELPADEVLVQQARKNIEDENYEEALEEITRAWQLGPRTAEKAFLLGRVYRALLKYPEAVQYLEEAVRRKEDYHEARFLLADTLMALEKVELAQSHLQKLREAGFQPAQTSFLLGVGALKKKDYKAAADYFREAEADPTLAQEARFQLGLALAGQDRLVEAREAMKEAISLDPMSQMSGFARTYVGELDKRLEATRRVRVNVTFGVDYDSNVTLNPGGEAAQQIAGAGDLVYTQTASLEVNFLPRGPWALWGQYGYFQNFHRRLPHYDLLSHVVGLTPSYSWANSRLWLPFAFNYTDVGSDKYYTAFTLNPGYLYLLTPKIGVELGMQVARKYYWLPVFLPEDDRSGRSLGGSLAFYYFLKKQEGYFMARFRYDKDFASGTNWESSFYSLMLAVLYPVTEGFKVRSFVELAVQPFDHAWTRGAWWETWPHRHDKLLIFGMEITQRIYKGLELNLHYYYARDNSNLALYDYRRHIMGCQLGYRY